MWGFLTFLFVSSYIKHFHNKLLALLVMEVIFIYSIYHIMIMGLLFQGLNFYFIAAFMVLDSMMGIVLLISSTRNSSVFSSIYSSF